MERQFGVLNKRLSLTFGPYSIETLPSAAAAIAQIMGLDVLVDDWIDPPRDHEIRLGSYGARSNAWYFYHLPNTHLVKCAGGGDEIERRTEFLVTYFGFLMGVRLVPEGWNHHLRSPWEVGHLVDFSCSDVALNRLLAGACEHWDRCATPELRKRLFAAVHWYLLGQCFQQEYESFASTYTALDACWSYWHDSNGRPYPRLGHSERCKKLCEHLSVQVPEFATAPPAGGRSPLATVRNDLAHDGIYGGEAVGFAYPSGELDFELAPLVSRLLIALISGPDEYTRSVYSRQRICIRE